MPSCRATLSGTEYGWWVLASVMIEDLGIAVGNTTIWSALLADTGGGYLRTAACDVESPANDRLQNKVWWAADGQAAATVQLVISCADTLPPSPAPTTAEPTAPPTLAQTVRCGNTAYQRSSDSAQCYCSPIADCAGVGCNTATTSYGTTTAGFIGQVALEPTEVGCRLSESVFNVLRPTQWSLITAGEAFNITWLGSETLASVDIRLMVEYRNATVVTIEDIAFGAPNTGTYSWRVSASIEPAGQFRVVVLPAGGGTLDYGFSPLFTIIELYSNCTDLGHAGNSTGGHSDLNIWRDDSLRTCADYGREGLCETDASSGDDVLSAAVGGRSAYEACCNCGGGIERENVTIDCMAVKVPPGTEPGTSPVAGVGDVCPVCERAAYLDPSSKACVPCVPGWLTPAVGTIGQGSCTIRLGDHLAEFAMFAGMSLGESHYEQHPIPVSVETCARICSLDDRCRSFDYESCSTSAGAIGMAVSLERAQNVGRCSLAQELYSSALPHAFTQTAGVDHYEKILPARSIEEFDRTPNAFVPDPTVIAHLADTSLQVCAAECIHRSEGCQSFAAGVSGRAGDCLLLAGTADANIALLIAGNPGVLERLDFYRRAPATPCPAGTWSVTGTQPSCTLCPAGSWSGAASTSCTTCTTGQLTRRDGSTSAAECEVATCASPSTGPDADRDCTCDVGSSCGGAEDCLVDGNTGVHYYKYYCTECRCSTTIHPPTVDFVWTPHTGAVLFWSETFEITYRVSNSVTRVRILLYRMHDSVPNAVTFVAVIALNTPAMGTYTWSVPSLPARDDYVVLVIHMPETGQARAPTHRNTGLFSIRNPVTTCEAGRANHITGAHPCAACPLDTYWQDARSCAQCPNGTRTAGLGSTTANDCTIHPESALAQFALTPNHYQRGGHAGGYYMEEIDHKTEEECARLCVDDAGCKAFVSGVADQHQAGDCFLEYDNSVTTWPGTIVPVSQLNYWEKMPIAGPSALATVSRTEFGFAAHCHMQENDNGGIFENSYTPETCAQLCLNDVCCKSFDVGSGGLAGVAGTELAVSTFGHCFLSYESTQTSPSEFLCDASYGLSYFERRIQIQAQVARSSSGGGFSPSVLSNPDFAQLASVAFADGRLIYTPEVAMATNAAGSLVASVLLNDITDQAAIVSAVEAGSVAFTYPEVIGDRYVASFTATEGMCLAGSVSQTGHKPGCLTCRAGTFANAAQTICQECPDGTDSEPGAFMVQQCVVPSANERHLLNVHDEFVGEFFAPDLGGGKLVLRVTNTWVNGSVEMIAAFTHGLFCDRTQNCRVEGQSDFYYLATVTDDAIVVAEYVTGFIGGTNGWVGITDRGFRRAPILGQIRITDTETTFSGSYGNDGTFNTTRRCTASTEDVVGFREGDLWRGHFECEALSEDGVKQAGLRHIQVASLTVDRVGDDDRVATTLQIHTENGTYSYTASGSYAMASRCQAMQLTPAGSDATANPAWQTERPTEMLARQWSGYLKEDGEHFEGVINLNSNCACGGNSPYVVGEAIVLDEFCGRIGEDFCWVTSACPEAIESTDHPGYFYAHIGPFQQCTHFKLARVCSVPPRVCSRGWTEHNYRCYRYFEQPADFDTASVICTMEAATQVSVHSDAEFAFLVDARLRALNASSAAFRNSTASEDSSGSGDDAEEPVPDVWLGLVRPSTVESYQWQDGSQFIFQDWMVGEPSVVYDNDTGVAMSMDRMMEHWKEEPDAALLPFFCKKPLLAVNKSCQCSGVSDPDRNGDRCLFWAANDTVPWCYTSQHCPTASHALQTHGINLWRSPCDIDLANQIYLQNPDAGGSPCRAGSFLNDTGCQRCPTADNCGPNQVIDGTCHSLESTQCSECHTSCYGCTSTEAAGCTSCAPGLLWGSSGLCGETCELGEYSNGTHCLACNSRCRACAGPGERNCTECGDGAGLYLLTTAPTSVGPCVENCSDSGPYFRHEFPPRCHDCANCSASDDAFILAVCNETHDVQCRARRTCSSYEVEAAAVNSTSDRECELATAAPASSTSTASPIAVPTKMEITYAGDFALIKNLRSTFARQTNASIQTVSGQVGLVGFGPASSLSIAAGSIVVTASYDATQLQDLRRICQYILANPIQVIVPDAAYWSQNCSFSTQPIVRVMPGAADASSGDNADDGDTGAVAGGVSVLAILLIAIALYALWRGNQRERALRRVTVLSEGHELATLANPVRTNQIDNGTDETIFDGEKPPEYTRPAYLDVAASAGAHPDSRAENMKKRMAFAEEDEVDPFAGVGYSGLRLGAGAGAGIPSGGGRRRGESYPFAGAGILGGGMPFPQGRPDHDDRASSSPRPKSGGRRASMRELTIDDDAVVVNAEYDLDEKGRMLRGEPGRRDSAIAEMEMLPPEYSPPSAGSLRAVSWQHVILFSLRDVGGGFAAQHPAPH